MAGIKRKELDGLSSRGANLHKKPRKEQIATKKSTKELHVEETATDSDPIVESDTASQSGEDDGVGWPSDGDEDGEERGGVNLENDDGDIEMAANTISKSAAFNPATTGIWISTSLEDSLLILSIGTSSREAHAKQKVEKQERKAAKPNADLIARSKKLWERLRRKSHVPLEERKNLIAELFDIVSGRVKDFVFKHDSVRVIQTALKYANLDQRKMITRELKGEYRTLAESRYAKFLIGKMLVHGDEEIRDMIVPEFCGHVKRLIKHPEASWILDDVYRGIATPSQKATMLREWYGAEYAIFKSSGKESISADLDVLLIENPEKRTPIMRSLHGLINLLVQKKTTGFTMLHDAMLQYYVNVRTGSEEATEFLELLKGDEEGDLLKNLAFTKSGARLVCLAVAHGNAKDRKQILKTFKDTFQPLMYDTHGHQVLLAMYDVIDDTVLVSKSVVPELVGKHPISPEQEQQILVATSHQNARISLLYPFCSRPTPAILPAEDIKLLHEVHGIRITKSKKEPETRRKELINALSPPLLSVIATHTSSLLSSSFGCQFIGEVLLEASGDRIAAMTAIAAIASGSEEEQALFNSPHAGRMLKNLVTGGRYNRNTNKIDPIEPPLGFHEVFYEAVKDRLPAWATGCNSFAIVALAEAPGFSKLKEMKKILKKTEHRERLEQAAREMDRLSIGHKGNKKGKAGSDGEAKGNKGTKLLLEKLEQ